MAKTRQEARVSRKKAIRKKMRGTAERPRLTVFRSLRHISVQVVNDIENRVIATATTNSKASAAEVEGLNKTDAAKKVGAKIAALCKEKGVEAVVFDRNGFKYHGRVRALAEAAREGGLSF
ncbi:MAG: 50S ribosomal protein L18 [Myxococcales bacterium]|nr:50S ribosomal protein L18 [Myxococcales bacterium]